MGDDQIIRCHPAAPGSSGQTVETPCLNQTGSAKRDGETADAVTLCDAAPQQPERAKTQEHINESERSVTPREIRPSPALLKSIEALVEGEKIAVMKAARHYARGTSHDPDDLIHEAIARILEGRRIWPPGLPAVQFFCGVMRSIAWEWRCDRRSEAPQTDDIEANPAGVDQALDADRIVALFDDDPVAKRMVLAMMEGARGEELQIISGLLDKKEYQTKRTKIRRRIEKISGPWKGGSNGA
jgi:RNA polymerase sigma-70 factor (ECF subfamily)